MKKLVLIFVLLFSTLLSPISIDAAQKVPTRYDEHVFNQAKKRVETSLKNAQKQALDTQKAYYQYIDYPTKSNQKLAIKSWERTSNSMTDYVKKMTIVIESNEKFKFDSTLSKWLEKQYKFSDEVWAEYILAYRLLYRIQQTQANITDDELRAAFKLKDHELYPLLSRLTKGWLDVTPGAPGNIHTFIDTLLSLKFDHPADVLSGYYTEKKLTDVYKEYFNGTELEGNKLLMSIPSAVGNTVSPTSVKSFSYPYHMQIKLLAIQLQLHHHLDDLFTEITKEFNDYGAFIESKKEKDKPNTTSPIKDDEDDYKVDCSKSSSPMQCLLKNVNNL